MDTDFKNLISLQNLDTEINKITLFLNNIPSQITAIEKKIEESDKAVASAKEMLAKNQKKRRDLEAEINDTNTQIEKYKRHLNDVKTNKEYSLLLKEIEDSQKKIESIEEEIISEMLNADDIEGKIQEANERASKATEKYSEEKNMLSQKSKEAEEIKKKLLVEKEKLIPAIPGDKIKLYQKILNKKNGVALSPVWDEFCSLCHMRIRPQMVNEIIALNTILLCENCGRILYWQEKSAESV